MEGIVAIGKCRDHKNSPSGGLGKEGFIFYRKNEVWGCEMKGSGVMGLWSENV